MTPQQWDYVLGTIGIGTKRRAEGSSAAAVSGAVPGCGMTSTSGAFQTLWKCSAAKRSGRPVAAAYIEGSRVEVSVVKIVRGGQMASSCAKTRPFSAGSS